MELDVEEAADERFVVDPVYEHIAAPKYWDFGRVSEEGVADKWFENPTTVMVESPASYHQPKNLLNRDSTPKKPRSLSGSPLRLHRKQGHPPSPGRALRRPAVGPSPLHKSVVSLNAIAVAAASASPQNADPAVHSSREEEGAEPSDSTSPPEASDLKNKVLPAEATEDQAAEPMDCSGQNKPTLQEDAKRRLDAVEEELVKGASTHEQTNPASAAGAFAQALGATLNEAAQPLFMRRHKKPLEIQTGKGGARRVAGRDLPGPSPSKQAAVSKEGSVEARCTRPLECTAAMQENVGVGGGTEGQRKPPAAPKPGHVRLKRSLDNPSWKAGAAESSKNKRRSEEVTVDAFSSKAAAARDSALQVAMVNGNRSSGSTDSSGSRSSQERGDQKDASTKGKARNVRRSLGLMNENATAEQSAHVRVAPTAVGRLKGRKSENVGMVRASSPRVEKVRAAWKLRRSMNVDVGGGKQEQKRDLLSSGVTHLLEQHLRSLSIAEETKAPALKSEDEPIEQVESPEKQGLEEEAAPPSSIEKAGQLLRRVGAAMGALLSSVSPLEKGKPEGGDNELEKEGGQVARVLHFGDKQEAVNKRKDSFLAPTADPTMCANADPDVPEVSPENEKKRRSEDKQQPLLQRIGAASRQVDIGSCSPSNKARKEGNRKRTTPKGKGGNILHARPLAVRLTLKEKERRLAVARRMAKLEEDSRKHAITMGWLRSSAAPVASSRPAAPHAPPKVTQPHPFPLRTEERGLLKQREWQAAVQSQRKEEEAARIPHAHPLPFSLDVPQVPPKPVVKQRTVPAPFDLESEKRHEAACARLEAELEREQHKVHTTKSFKARPASSLGTGIVHESAVAILQCSSCEGSSVPNVASRVAVTSSITEAESFAFRTDQRAQERREFEQLLADKTKAAQREKEQQERRKKEREEAEVLALRRSLVVRAQPMPFFDKPFKPRKSTKGLTVPHSPKFSLMSYQKAQKPAPPPTLAGAVCRPRPRCREQELTRENRTGLSVTPTLHSLLGLFLEA